MARFTKATGIHDGEEKVAQTCFEQNTSYNAAAGTVQPAEPGSTAADGDLVGKKETYTCQ